MQRCKKKTFEKYQIAENGLSNIWINELPSDVELANHIDECV